MSRALQLADAQLLLAGQHARHDLVDADLAGHGLGREARVAGEQQRLGAQGTQARDGLRAGGLHRVGHRHQADSAAVRGKEERCLCLGRQGVRALGKAAQVNAALLHEPDVSGKHAPAIDGARKATARHLLEALHAGARIHARMGLVSIGADGLGQRVLALALQGAGHAHEVCLGDASRKLDVGHARLAGRDGAGLVQHHVVH